MAIDSMEHERTAADMNRIPKAGWRMSGGNWIGPLLFVLLVARLDFAAQQTECDERILRQDGRHDLFSATAKGPAPCSFTTQVS